MNLPTLEPLCNRTILSADDYDATQAQRVVVTRPTLLTLHRGAIPANTDRLFLWYAPQLPYQGNGGFADWYGFPSSRGTMLLSPGTWWVLAVLFLDQVATAGVPLDFIDADASLPGIAERWLRPYATPLRTFSGPSVNVPANTETVLAYAGALIGATWIRIENRSNPDCMLSFGFTPTRTQGIAIPGNGSVEFKGESIPLTSMRVIGANIAAANNLQLTVGTL